MKKWLVFLLGVSMMSGLSAADNAEKTTVVPLVEMPPSFPMPVEILQEHVFDYIVTADTTLGDLEKIINQKLPDFAIVEKITSTNPNMEEILLSGRPYTTKIKPLLAQAMQPATILVFLKEPTEEEIIAIQQNQNIKGGD